MSLPSSKKKNITQRRGRGRGRRGGTTAQVVGPTILEEEDEDKDDDYSTEEQPQELSRRLNDAGPSSSPTFTPMKEEQDNKATDDPNNNTIIESSSWENKKTPPASATAQPPSSPPPQSEHATSLSSSEEINVDVKNDNNQGGTTTSNEETSTDQENNNNTWSIGDIVFVKSRTWPGVNKPGGVARITKCHPEDRTYNVCYILGGRESKVDAIFIQTHSDKKQKRASTELPKSLLQELEAQGFDTTGKAVVTMVEEPKQPPPTLKDSTNRNQKTAATAVGTSGRKRKSAEKEQRTTSKVTTTNQKRKSVNAKATTTSTTSNANRKRKSSEKEDKGSKSDHTKTSNKRKNFPKNPHTAAPPKLALPVLSDEEACQRADTRYQELFQAALKGKVINIVASNLTDRDMDVLKALCSKSLSGDGKYP